MSRNTITLFLIIVLANFGWAQRKERLLPYQINKGAWNASHPVISGDGKTLIFLTDYSEYPGLSMYMSVKEGVVWSEPEEMSRLVNRPDMTLRGAISLNYNGDILIVTSRKSGLGGFELWYSERQGNEWSALKNFGAPINSSTNEGAGMFTPDGTGMFFMRCDKMTELSASGCKIYYTEKKYGRWEEPQMLPENINSMNPQMPRILADGTSLIFASDAPGGKGNFDLYITRKTEDGWEDPKNMAFINTPEDDIYGTVEAKGRYFMTFRMGDRKKYQLIEYLIPKEFQPNKTYQINGTVKDTEGNPLPAEIRVFDLSSRERLINEKIPSDGTFSLVLKEGSNYDVSINPVDRSFEYFSRIYELEEVPSRDRETLDLVLEKPTLDEEIINDLIKYKDYKSEISEESTYELRRIAAFLRGNPNLNVKITSVLYDYREDSVMSDDDLTEIRVDTLINYVTQIVPSRHVQTTIADTLFIENLLNEDYQLYNQSDTLYASVNQDTVMLKVKGETIKIPALEESYVTVYHNNRTGAEAMEIKKQLVTYGVEEERIQVEGYVAQKETNESKSREILITFTQME